MTAGRVLFNPQFVFHDGDSAPKLFVTLNDGADGSYLTVLTTSRRHNKSGVAGCHVTQFPSNFHFPAGTAFPKDSWLILNSVYEFDAVGLDQECTSGSIQVKLPLTVDDLREVLDCILQDEDLSKEHWERLTAFRSSLGV